MNSNLLLALFAVASIVFVFSSAYAEEIKINLGETVSYENLNLNFYDIEDSRCPLDVTCVWEGKVSAKIHVHNETHKIGGGLEIDYPLTYITPYTITLIDVKPHPISTEKPDYVAILDISKMEKNSDISFCEEGTVYVDGTCQVIKAEKTKTVGDDAPFFGIFAFFEQLFSWIMPSSQEESVTLSEQETRQLIQDEISQSPKITGILAQDVCTILDLECTSQTSFNAIFDPTDGYTKFSYSKGSKDYFFRVADVILEYRSEGSTEWRTLEDDFADTFGWGDSLETKEVVDDNLSHTFYFDSDKLGNYEKWCSMYNGTFHPNVVGSKVGCEFATQDATYIARDGLHEFQKKTISGDLAQKLCRAYGKTCELGIFITMEYDMETGELYKLKRNEDTSSGHYYTEYRIIDNDVIQYRYPTGHASPEFPWKTFED